MNVLEFLTQSLYLMFIYYIRMLINDTPVIQLSSLIKFQLKISTTNHIMNQIEAMKTTFNMIFIPFFRHVEYEENTKKNISE